MRRDHAAINPDSDEYNALFTSDGKLDFKSRIGLDREADPLRRVSFKADPRDRGVQFQEHRDLRDLEVNSRSHQLDDDDYNYNEKW